MTTQCTSTADAISGVLLAGDLVLNLSPQPLNTTSNTRHLTVQNDCLTAGTTGGTVAWEDEYADAICALLSSQDARIVVVSQESDATALVVMQELTNRSVPCTHCVLAADCESDSYMDEEDAEAVAERLRQLGYL
ncbi:MAG: hypothetical protein KDA91_07355 [Planctomycetaceae bacterium]|nr:hypothetical protein [Planctomycetaceae bacterium]